jgi:hypothetical protein
MTTRRWTREDFQPTKGHIRLLVSNSSSPKYMAIK